MNTHDTETGNETHSTRPDVNNGPATTLGSGQAPLTSPGRPDLKRKFSKVDIDINNANQTLSMFMGGQRHSWMQGGSGSYAPRAQPVKKPKPTPTKPVARPEPSPAPSATPISIPAQPRSRTPPAISSKQTVTEPIVITIPDTQPDDNRMPSPDIEMSQVVTEVDQEPTDATSVRQKVTNEPVPPPQPVITSTEAQRISSATTLPPSDSVARISSPIDMDMGLVETARPLDRNISASHQPTAPPPHSQKVPPKPRLQTTVPTRGATNIVPQTLVSPMSAAVTGMAGLAVGGMPPTPTTSSPMASPRMLPPPATIDIPRTMPDGTCRIHHINIHNATIGDHNLLVVETQRVMQQLKDSVSPENGLVIRYSKLKQALDFLRSQINHASIQTPLELITDIQRQTPPTPGPSISPAVAHPAQSLDRALQISNQNVVERPNMGHGPIGPPQFNPNYAYNNVASPVHQFPPQQSNHAQQPPMGHFPFQAQAQNAILRPNHPFPNQAPSISQLSPTNTIPSPTGYPPFVPENARSHPQQIISQIIQQQRLQQQQVQQPQVQPQQQQMQQNTPQNYPQGVQQMQSGSNLPPSWSRQYIGELQKTLRRFPSSSWGPNDAIRMSFLQDALMQGDDIFVALHLIFCTADHRVMKQKYPFRWLDERGSSGLELLSQLLFPNKSLSAQAMNVFVTVPLEFGQAMHTIPGFANSVGKASLILQSLRSVFDKLYKECVAKKIPCPSPKLTALMVSLGIHSLSLHKLIGVSLCQMLKALISNNQNSPQAVQIAPAPSSSPTGSVSTSATIPQNIVQQQPIPPHNPQAPREIPECRLFITDWGAKINGFRLIMDWKHLPAQLEKPPNDASPYYTYFNRCITPVHKVEILQTHKISFNISHPLARSVPKKNREEGSELSTRPVYNGAKLYRLRCVAATMDLTQSTTPDDFSTWRSKDTAWPPHFFAEVNENINQIIDRSPNASVEERELSKSCKLHFRRKKLWGKDCATDITDGLVLGENSLQFMWLDRELDSGNAYYLAIEEIEISTHKELVDRITKTQFICAKDSKIMIMNRLKVAKDAMANDDEISVVDDTVTVSIVCPMSQRFIDIPVRGKNCKHLDCFDLETYLGTRPKYGSGFSVPDFWKCPICSCECAPPNLIVDGYMQETVTSLREQQAKNKFLDTKSVVIRWDGMWRPKEPPESSTTKSIKKERQSPEYIVLDDD